MRYALLDDTREWSGPGHRTNNGHTVCLTEIEAEARRRKNLLRIDEWRMREYVTGNPIPVRIDQVCHQIDLAAQALARMSVIPADYADDVYWPRIW